MHNVFHVSNLKKCLLEETPVVPIREIRVDENLNFVEEPIEIVERDIKKLRRSRNPIVKVRWNSCHGPEFTWEREDEFLWKYPKFRESLSSNSKGNPGRVSSEARRL